MSISSLPQINAQLLAANGLIGPNPFRTLMVGQIGSGGSAVSGTPYQSMQTLSTSAITALFGSNSELTNRILRHLAVLNGTIDVWVIGLSPALYATAATFAMAITGTATIAGTLVLQLVDAYNYTINVTVNVGDTATTVANNIMTAITGLGTLQPFTVNQIGATINFTASDVGSLGNKYTIGVVGNIPAGLTVPVGQFAGGATDPSNTNIFTNVSATRFHRISWPWQTNYTTLKNFLDARNVVNNAFLQGIGMIGYDDTETNIHNALNGSSTVNDMNLEFIGNKQINGVSQIITPPDWRVVEYMAIEALRLTPGAAIGKYVISTAPNDSVGGPGLASLPLFNTPLPFTMVANPSNLFTQTEQNNNQIDGYTVIGVNPAGLTAIIGQAVTTYKYNGQGAADPTFHFKEYVETEYMALEIFYNTQKSDFAQTRLTLGDLVAGFNMQNQGSITAECLNTYRSLENVVLVASGKLSEQSFLNNLVITLNTANGMVTESGKWVIITQLRQIVMTWQISFSF